MLDRTAAWLVEIEMAISDIRGYTHGFDESSFLADEKTCAATAMKLVVIGEAAVKLRETVGKEAPEIPWPKIVSVRNRIVHGYGTVDHTKVWDIVENQLDALANAVARMLVARGEA